MHNEIVGLLNNRIKGVEATFNKAEVGDSSISVNPAFIVDVCKLLKESGTHEFNVLQVITGCDYPEYLELSYIIASFINNTELILKVKLQKQGDSLPKIASVSDVWKAANWLERECYDMVGVEFTGHPDCGRILCPDGFVGYPLRKDFKSEESYNGMVINPASKMK